MDSTGHTNDDEIMASWYAYAADEPDFVGYWLSLLRKREGITELEQQDEFGADEPAFLRLQAMPLPSTQKLARDAHRIAEACNLKKPMAFVQAMLLARGLEKTEVQPVVEELYQAAFDEEDLE